MGKLRMFHINERVDGRVREYVSAVVVTSRVPTVTGSTYDDSDGGSDNGDGDSGDDGGEGTCVTAMPSALRARSKLRLLYREALGW